MAKRTIEYVKNDVFEFQANRFQCCYRKVEQNTILKGLLGEILKNILKFYLAICEWIVRQELRQVVFPGKDNSLDKLVKNCWEVAAKN